jgi:hypothetical protein
VGGAVVCGGKCRGLAEHWSSSMTVCGVLLKVIGEARVV